MTIETEKPQLVDSYNGIRLTRRGLLSVGGDLEPHRDSGEDEEESESEQPSRPPASGELRQHARRALDVERRITVEECRLCHRNIPAPSPVGADTGPTTFRSD